MIIYIMERTKIRVGKGMHLWVVLSLICSFTPLNRGCILDENGGCFPDDVPEVPLEELTYPKEAIVQSMEVDGYFVDCVDIHKQPSLQHPLLVNHTIQLNPIFPSGMKDGPIETSYPLNLSRSCPEGTIPIEKLAFGPHPPLPPPPAKHQRVLVRVSGQCVGARANINVWNPLTEKPSERTLASIWVISPDINTMLKAGWMVYPSLYKDNKVRFFISWTADGKGCFNFNCRGFIQTNRQHLSSAILNPVSQFSGPQFEVTVEIIKDATGKWWVRRQGHDIGYWPQELVPALAGGAQFADFGGEVVWDAEGRPHTATDMGSGRYPGEGFGKAAFFRNVLLLNPSQLVYEAPKNPVVSAKHEECYDLKVGGTNDPKWGYYFYYGGPGRSDGCT